MIPKILQVKKRHHYIWAEHLRRWARGKNIFYSTLKGKVALGSVRGLAVESDFYKISALDDRDVSYLRLWSKAADSSLRDMHYAYLDMFIKASRLISVPEELRDNAELIRLSEVAQNNTLEDIHGKIERIARPVLDKLCDGNSECLKNPSELTAFYAYMAQQLMRTKGIKDLSIKKSKEHLPDDPRWVEGSRLFEKTSGI